MKLIFWALIAATIYVIAAVAIPAFPLPGAVKLAQCYFLIAGWLAYAALGHGETFKKVEEAIISALLAITTLLVFFEVLLRYGFNTGVSWIQEATLLMAGWMVLLGMAYGIKVGSHIGVDAIVRLLSSEARRKVTILAVLLCGVYCVLFLYGGWVYTEKLFKIGIEMQDIPLPKWAAFGALMVGFILLFVRFAELLKALLAREVDGFSLADEAKEALEMNKKSEVGSIQT